MLVCIWASWEAREARVNVRGDDPADLVSVVMVSDKGDETRMRMIEYDCGFIFRGGPDQSNLLGVDFKAPCARKSTAVALRDYTWIQGIVL